MPYGSVLFRQLFSAYLLHLQTNCIKSQLREDISLFLNPYSMQWVHASRSCFSFCSTIDEKNRCKHTTIKRINCDLNKKRRSFRHIFSEWMPFFSQFCSKCFTFREKYCIIKYMECRKSCSLSWERMWCLWKFRTRVWICFPMTGLTQSAFYGRRPAQRKKHFFMYSRLEH